MKFKITKVNKSRGKASTRRAEKNDHVIEDGNAKPKAYDSC